MTMPFVDLIARCECGAAVSGTVHRNRMRQVMAIFRAAHAPECAAIAKKGGKS